MVARKLTNEEKNVIGQILNNLAKPKTELVKVLAKGRKIKFKKASNKIYGVTGITPEEALIIFQYFGKNPRLKSLDQYGRGIKTSEIKYGLDQSGQILRGEPKIEKTQAQREIATAKYQLLMADFHRVEEIYLSNDKRDWQNSVLVGLEELVTKLDESQEKK